MTLSFCLPARGAELHESDQRGEFDLSPRLADAEISQLFPRADIGVNPYNFDRQGEVFQALQNQKSRFTKLAI